MTVKAHVQTPALLKADLAIEIYNIIEARKLTQAKAGKILGVAPSDISRLKKGDFNQAWSDCLHCSIVLTGTGAVKNNAYQTRDR